MWGWLFLAGSLSIKRMVTIAWARPCAMQSWPDLADSGAHLRNRCLSQLERDFGSCRLTSCLRVLVG